MSEQPVAEETLDLRTCGMAKPDPIAKKITGEEMYWHNVVGGSLYIGGSPPISNGADIRMIIVGKDHFMHCGHCERETMMRYQVGKSKGTKIFWTRKVPGILTCCLWPKLIKLFCLGTYSKWIEKGSKFTCLRCKALGHETTTRDVFDVLLEQDPKETNHRYAYYFTVEHEIWSDAKMLRIKNSRYNCKVTPNKLLGDNEKIMTAHSRKKDKEYLAGEGV